MSLKLFVASIISLFFLLFSALTFAQIVVSNQPVHVNSIKKVLIIASNVADMGDPEKHEARNDLWEYAPPYHVFVLHGYQVDFASPQGGAVPFMRDPLGISSYTIKYEGFLNKASNSLAPKQVNASEYSAVFIGGGYGNLFDVASNKDLLAIITKIYESGGVIGSSGHGAGGFANAKLSNGQPLVKGKRIAGFPNSTEKAKDWAKQGSLLPFLVEERLKENGAITVNKDNIPDKHEVIVDDRIVSTMFLPSAALVAKEMLIVLEKSGKPGK
jgi:putative intracellular protease/amidase